MRGTHTYEVAASYPHMGKEDAAVWSRYIAAFPDKYESVTYDEKIGFVPAFVLKDEARIGGDIANLYYRKIDVLGFGGDAVDIIEVKPRAQFATIGQVLGYMALWKEKHGDVTDVEPIIVTGDAPLDVRIVAEQQGVTVVVV